MRVDTANQNRVSAKIIGELNTPKETEIKEVACNEELSLAKEFGAAKLLGSGRKANKNPTSCDITNPSARDKLSDTPSLRLSHDMDGNRVHKQKASCLARTWTCRERISSKNNTAAQVKLQGKKRMVAFKVSHMAGLAKRFQVIHNEEEKSFVVAGADVQPRQGQ